LIDVPREVPVDALLFDLGGVIIEIDFGRAFAHWAGRAGVEAAALQERWRMDDPYAQHEIGRIDAPGYFASLRDSLGIDLPDAEFEAGWQSIFLREVPGIRPVLEAAAKRWPLYLFSNTNVSHHRHWSSRYGDVLAYFQRIFVSNELGKRKPDPVAFHAVAQAIDVPPERILFFDDTLSNVEGALAVGMQAVHVKSVADTERAIARLCDTRPD
jgi:putative hydrolase of the HAD superfamily